MNEAGILRHKLYLLENFIQRNIRVYIKKTVKKQKIKKGDLIPMNTTVNSLIPMYIQNRFSKTLNFEAIKVSDSKFHINAITNPSIFQNLHVCICGKKFFTSQNLFRHQIRVCGRQNQGLEAIPNTPFSFPLTMTACQDRLGAYLAYGNKLVLIQNSTNRQTFEVIITLTHNRCVIFKTTYTANSIQQLVFFIFEFLSLLPDERQTELVPT